MGALGAWLLLLPPALAAGASSEGLTVVFGKGPPTRAPRRHLGDCGGGLPCVADVLAAVYGFGQDEPADEAAAEGCDTTCEVAGQRASCRERVMWLAEHEYHGKASACAMAHGSVEIQCPACAAACPLLESRCEPGLHPAASAPAPAPAAAAAAGPTGAGGGPAEHGPHADVEAGGPDDPAGCGAECLFEGARASCALRVQWSAANTFAGEGGACGLALAVVQKDCPVCSGCSLGSTGCPASAAAAPAPSQASGCGVTCVLDGEAGLCSQRIQWAMDNKFAGQADACSRAHALALGQCEVCSGCTLREAGCLGAGASRTDASTSATTTTTPKFSCRLSPGREGAHALWSEARRAWCCENHGLGCPTKTQYDCSEDYFDWERLWSEEKKAWCCMAKGRGCPASTTSTRPPRRKSAEQPSSGDELFNCTAGYAQREQGWSESKLEWCCRHKTIGCSVWSSAGRKFGMVAVEAATSPGPPAFAALAVALGAAHLLGCAAVLARRLPALGARAPRSGSPRARRRAPEEYAALGPLSALNVGFFGAAPTSQDEESGVPARLATG